MARPAAEPSYLKFPVVVPSTDTYNLTYLLLVMMRQSPLLKVPSGISAKTGKQFSQAKTAQVNHEIRLFFISNEF